MIKYKVIERETCMTVEELDEEWKKGYELIAAVGTNEAYAYATRALGPTSTTVEDPPAEYCFYFKYVGGLGSARSIMRGN